MDSTPRHKNKKTRREVGGGVLKQSSARIISESKQRRQLDRGEGGQPRGRAEYGGDLKFPRLKALKKKDRKIG